jgi:hypothetical protein
MRVVLFILMALQYYCNRLLILNLIVIFINHWRAAGSG